MSICASSCVCATAVCLHKEVLCSSSPKRGGADKTLNVCIVLANELEQNGREYVRKKAKETEGGRRGTAAIVLSLILLMVLKALAGKQMLFCEMHSIFFPPDFILSKQPGAQSLLPIWEYIQFEAENSNLRMDLAVVHAQELLASFSIFTWDLTQ